MHTDGSKSDLGVGFGATIYALKEKTEILGKLPDHCTVYQAELLAIQTTVEFLVSARVLCATVLIFSASMSLLQSTRNRQCWIAAEIGELIDELQKYLELKIQVLN